MATHRSAEKRARQNVRRAQRNTHVITGVKTAVKAFRHALQLEDRALSTTALAHATRVLQKAGSANVIKAGAVSRRVGRLAAAHHRAFASRS